MCVSSVYLHTSILSIIILLMFTQMSNSSPIFFDVPANGEQCFYEAYEVNESMEFLYVIKRGGEHDIELKIYNPFDDMIAQQIGIKYEKFSQIMTQSGVYKICFNNGMSHWTSKMVGIDILGDHRPPVSNYNELTHKRHLNTMEKTLMSIADNVDNIWMLVELGTDMEDVFWESVMNANSIFSYITLLEMCLLCIIYVYQIKQIRSWFSKSGGLFNRSSGI